MYTNEKNTTAVSIENGLHIHPQLTDCPIAVHSEGHVIILTGTVKSEAQKNTAEEYARTTPGVVSVRNDLRVANETSQSVGEYISDAMITAAIKAKLLAEEGLPSGSISVETNNGTVALSGKTENNTQALLAEQIAMRTDGVRHVQNLLISTSGL